MMNASRQIERLKRTGLCGLLACTLTFSMGAFAFGDTDNPSSVVTKKSPQTAASASTKSKQSSSKNALRSKSAPGKKGAKKSSKKVGKKRGQQAIDSSRTREIQMALIREHYLQGEASGTWDSNSQAAMQRYQADHGWQSKTTPDSRALIELGLGPSSNHLLNPESAMTTIPTESKPATKQRPQENMSQQ